MRRPASLTLAVAVLALAGCGSDDDEDSGTDAAQSGTDTAESGGGGGGETLKLSADPGGALKFDKSSLTAKAGTVTIDFTNPSSASAPHAVEIEGNGVEEVSETIDPGGQSSVTAELEPGSYELYCPVGNHEQEGMTGTLTVE
jgi:plastocyanin